MFIAYLQPLFYHGGGSFSFELLLRTENGRGASPSVVKEMGLNVLDVDKLAITSAVQLFSDDSQCSIHVNQDPSSLLNQAHLKWVKKALEPFKDRVFIEVTESEVQDEASIVDALVELSRQGFRLALDDACCGTGSVMRLASGAIDMLKFRRALVEQPCGPDVVLALANFVSYLVIEEIETDRDAQQVIDGLQSFDGILVLQGFRFGKPDRADLVLSRLT